MNAATDQKLIHPRDRPDPLPAPAAIRPAQPFLKLLSSVERQAAVHVGSRQSRRWKDGKRRLRSPGSTKSSRADSRDKELDVIHEVNEGLSDVQFKVLQARKRWQHSGTV